MQQLDKDSSIFPLNIRESNAYPTLLQEQLGPHQIKNKYFRKNNPIYFISWNLNYNSDISKIMFKIKT